MHDSAYIDLRPGRSWSMRFATRLAERIVRRLSRGFYARSVHLGLSFTLDPEKLRPVQPGLVLRRLTPAYVEHLLPADTSHLQDTDRIEVEQRRKYAEFLPQHGYVVVDEKTGEPCYLMWVLTHADNELVARLEGVPPLEPHQALMEGAYVPPHYRGRRIMTPAGTLIMTKAIALGATEALSFIGETNTPSLRGAARAGFRPYRRHVRHHLLFGLLVVDRYEKLTDAEIEALTNG